MNTILEKNLKFLGATLDDINSIECDFKYKISKAVNGEDTLELEDLTGKMKRIHSIYDPSYVSKRTMENLKFKKEEIINFVGLGLGYELLELIEKCGKRNKIVVIEKNRDLFLRFISLHDVEELNEKVDISFLLFTDMDNLYEFYNINFAVYEYEKMTILFTRGYKGVIDDVFASVIRQIIAVGRKSIMTKNTSYARSRLWFENSIENLPYLLESCDTNFLMGKLKGTPAIIVSAGPSLTKNVELLRKAKGKFLIICVYTAYKVLEKYGIEPDFVIAVDGLQIPFEHHKVKKFETRFLTSLIVNHEMMEISSGKKSFMGTITDLITDNLLNFLGKEYFRTETGGSVACSALDFANKLGCNPLIFVGQDLAFTDNKTHSAGTIYEDRSAENEGDIVYIDGFDGGRVKSSVSLESFKIWFEAYIAMFKEDKTFINATEGGANIRGAENRTLGSVIDEYSGSVDLDRILNELDGTRLFSDEEKMAIVGHIDYLANSYDLIIQLLEEVVSYSAELCSLYEDEKTLDNDKIFEAGKHVDEINSELGKYEDELALGNNVFSIIYEKLESLDIEEMSEDQIIVNRNLIEVETKLELCKFIKEQLVKASEILAVKYK